MAAHPSIKVELLSADMQDKPDVAISIARDWLDTQHVDLITDLPETVSAIAVSALYRKRWTLETAFQHLEKHFESEINTLAYPRVALFGFCLALVAYNIFQVTLDALDSAHQEPVSSTVSTYYVGREIAATFLALLMLSESGDWRFLARLSPADFAQWLRDVASGVNPKKYRKHGRGPKKPCHTTTSPSAMPQRTTCRRSASVFQKTDSL